MTERKILQEFYNLQTCSERRLNKIKNVLKRSRQIIKKDLTALNITDITKFLKYLNNSDYKQWTKNDYKKIFKNFLKWNYKKDFLEWNENKNFREGFKSVSKNRAFNKEKINKNTLLKEEELEILLRTAKSLKWKALLTLLYESAFRPCEIRILKWKDLNFDDSLNVCRITTLSPKTKEQRTVPVRDCIIHLKRWREEFQFPNINKNDYCFPSQIDRTKPLGEGTITTLIRRLSKEAKIRNVFPYMFRHTRIYEIQKKLGSRVASKFAGHSLETSEIYNHLDSDDVEEAMLEKIYTTEELTPEEKNRIAELQKQFEKYKFENERYLEKVKKSAIENYKETENLKSAMKKVTKFLELQKEGKTKEMKYLVFGEK
jgi:integrase